MYLRYPARQGRLLAAEAITAQTILSEVSPIRTSGLALHSRNQYHLFVPQVMTAVAITVPGFPYGRFAGVDYGDCGTFKHEYGDGWYIGHIDPETKRADGLGMLKFANGSAYSGLCADGKRHGHWLVRSASGTMRYHKYDDGTARHEAVENINGTLSFDRQQCDATDARFMELRRLALDVAVGPAPLTRTRPRAMPAHGRRFVPAGSSRGRREQDRGAPPFQSATMHARRSHGLYEHGAAVCGHWILGTHARKHMCRPRLAACRPGVAPSFSFPCRRAHCLRTDFP